MLQALQLPQRRVNNMYNIYNTVSDLIVDVDLAVGDSKRVNCPNCGGIIYQPQFFSINLEQRMCLCPWMISVLS